MIVDFQIDTADNFRHIHPFGPDAQILLEEIWVAAAAHDAHRDGADVDIRFVAHFADCHRTAREAQNLFLHVSGN